MQKALITLEQVNTSGGEKNYLYADNFNREANWSGGVNFH